MPIPYYRHEACQRSVGDCAIRKSAYFARKELYYEGSCVLEAQTFNYSSRKEDLEYHSVLLPKGADKRFKDLEYLWNKAAKAEKRINAQEAWVGTFALPKESVISNEDRIRIAEKFAQKYFVSKGLIVQIDIHSKQGNPHAHFLITQRHLKKDGREFGVKARDLKEEFFSTRWPFETQTFLDAEFKAMGLDLRCDPPGIVSQIHLGLKGSWGRAFDLYLENQERIELNHELAKDPKEILGAITKYQSVFSPEEIDRFIDKHTPEDHIETVKEAFWKQEAIVQMLDKKTGERLDLFSVKEVIGEENTLEKVSALLLNRKAKPVSGVSPKRLNPEQKKAFYSLTKGEGLMTLRGYAGTGKSYVLEAVAKAYTEEGASVYALGADNAAASALKEKGLNAQNVYRFLYRDHFAREKVSKGSVIIVDEAGKLGNQTMGELLKFAARKKARLILSGDSAQFSPVERGGFFKYCCEKTQGPKLENIQRQADKAAAEISINLAKGNTSYAIDRLLERKQIHFANTRAEAMSDLAKRWASDHSTEKASFEESIIITATTKESHILNEMIRRTRIKWGEIEGEEVLAKTTYGHLRFAKGDSILFRGNDQAIGVENGMRGTLIFAKDDTFSVEIKEGKNKSRLIHFDPKEYRKFHHGYAINANLSQGGTWKRSYFLHAPHLSQQMLYVAASRHVDDFQYFIAKTDASSIADFKRQAKRDNSKTTTLECANEPTLAIKAAKDQKAQAILDLKNSDRFRDTIKGHFQGAGAYIKSKLEERSAQQKDTAFYDYRSNIKLHPVDQSDQVRQRGTVEAMAAQKKYVYSLRGEILNKVDADKLFHAFLKENEVASEKRALAEKESETLNIPLENTPSFKELGQNTSRRNSIAKAFIEKAAWDGSSIQNDYGDDVERTFVLSAKKFDQSFDLSKLKTIQEDPLFEMWKDTYRKSRSLLKNVRLDSSALFQDESKHSSYAESFQASKVANWIAWAKVNCLEDLSDKEPTLSEKNQALFSKEGALALERGAQAFANSLKNVELFKEGGIETFKEKIQTDLFRTEKTGQLLLIANRYEETIKEISKIEREVGEEIGERTDMPHECPSYKKLTHKLFGARGALAAALTQNLSKEKTPLEEVFVPDIIQKVKYQSESFEARFSINRKPIAGKMLPEMKECAQKYIASQEKAFPLLRELAIKEALLGKEEGPAEGLFEALEAKSIMETLAYMLKDKLKELGKDPEELLHEKTLKQAKRIEEKFNQVDPILSESATGKIKTLGSLYKQTEIQEKFALLSCRKEQIREGKPFEACEMAEGYFAARGDKNRLSFAILQEAKTLTVSPILAEKFPILEAQAERFEKTLEVGSVMKEPLEALGQEETTSAKPSKELSSLIEKYQEKLEKLSALRREDALNAHVEAEESLSKDLAIEYRARNTLASQITETCSENSIPLSAIVSKKYAQKIPKEGKSFERRFEEKKIFKGETKDKDLLSYQKLSNQAQLLEKLLEKQTAKERVDPKETLFFDERNKACRERNQKAWALMIISPEKETYFSKEGLKQLHAQAATLEKSLTPSPLWEKEDKTARCSFQDFIVKWDQERREVLRARKELILDKASEKKIDAAHYQLLGEAADRRNETAHHLIDFLKKEGKEITEIGLTASSQSAMIAHEKSFFNKLESGKAFLEGEMVQEGIEVEERLEEALVGFSSAYKEAGETRRLALLSAKAQGVKVFETEDWKEYSKARAVKNTLAVKVDDLIKENGKKSQEIFTTAGESALRGSVADFEKRFTCKSPLAEEDIAEKDHPLVKEYCQLGESIVNARKQYAIDKATKEAFPKESFENLQGLTLQQKALSTPLYETFGEERLFEIFKEKNAQEIAATKEEVEKMVTEKVALPSVESPFDEKPSKKKEGDWICLKPDPNIPPPETKILGDYTEKQRYPYRDANGEVLHFVLRLEDPQGNKMTPPLSYGHFAKEEKNPHWRLKGYDYGEEKRSLYNLDLVEKYPTQPVIIVEGEKAADAAPSKLKTFQENDAIAVTWSGGCGAALKTDWTPLAGREVLIWPDNDQGGYKAAREIEKELGKVRAREIKVIDKEWLTKNFEKGWDLADPWPPGIKKEDLEDNAQEIHVSEAENVFWAHTTFKDRHQNSKQGCLDIVRAFKEGREERIEQWMEGKDRSEKDHVITAIGIEAFKIYRKEDELYQKLGEDPFINASGELQKHLTRQCTLFEAGNGREPTLSEINLMKETLQEAEKSLGSLPLGDISQKELDCVKQRTFETLCNEAFKGRDIALDSEHTKTLFLEESKSLEQAQMKEHENLKVMERQQELEHSRGHGMDIGP